MVATRFTLYFRLDEIQQLCGRNLDLLQTVFSL
jgi:hypothetical protein